MSTLDEKLMNAPRARLIPTLHLSRGEERIVSILLATLSVVYPFAERLLKRCSVTMGKRSDLDCYSEIEFPVSNDNTGGRVDGILRLTTPKRKWTAILEAKVGNAEINTDQVIRYAEIAREYEIDAIITLSNQLVALPTHLPYSIPKKFTNRISFFHISWSRLLTEASLILKDERIGSDIINNDQAFILEEMKCYMEHPVSGIKRFSEMNPEWKSLVLGVRDGYRFKRSSSEIENTIASWHQEEQDICLILSRLIGKQVGIRLSRKHESDQELRHKDACDTLIASHELRCAFTIPNAANDLEVSVNLQRRTISSSMKLLAPGDKKGSLARIRWLGRQLNHVDGNDVTVRAFWPGPGQPTSALLSDVNSDPRCLVSGRPSAVPRAFEVLLIKDVAGRFSGKKSFIEDLEEFIPEFYERIGQHLRRWTPPPPSIERNDQTQDTSIIDMSDRLDGENISQPEMSQTSSPSAPAIEDLLSTEK